MGVGGPVQSLSLGEGGRDVRERCFDNLTRLWWVLDLILQL